MDAEARKAVVALRVLNGSRRDVVAPLVTTPRFDTRTRRVKEIQGNDWLVFRRLCRRADLSLRAGCNSTRKRIKTFGAEFDPQPFHLDEAAARHTIFCGLAARGWHTTAVTMRRLVESDLKPAGGIVGAGFDALRRPRRGDPGMSCASRARCSRCGRGRRRATRASTCASR